MELDQSAQKKGYTEAPEIRGGDARFFMRDSFLYMAYPKDAAPCRVMLHRNFPLEFPYEYLSVQDTEGHELASIRKLSDFDEESHDSLQKELERKYYSPQITRIVSIKERFGFSYWEALTDDGKLTFTLKDTYKSILRTGGKKIFIVDVEGNRFTIDNVDALDKKSRKKIEIYL